MFRVKVYCIVCGPSLFESITSELQVLLPPRPEWQLYMGNELDISQLM